MTIYINDNIYAKVVSFDESTVEGFTLIDDVLTINFGGEHVVVKPLIMDSDTTYVTRDRFDGLVQQLKKTMDTV
jgi:hypothetical protein